MNGAPLVSVLMTAYNRQQYIADAIQSVLNSTYVNFELIICDDCSIDDTVAIARSFAQEDHRIQVHVNNRNLGDYPNRNRAASYAKGKYLFYVDSDDMILKDGIENCIDNFLRFPEARFATYYSMPANDVRLLPPAIAIRNHFFKQPYLMIGPTGTIIEREYFIDIGGFPEKYGPANDNYYNLKAAAGTPVLLIPFLFYFYRTHPTQEIHNLYSYLYNNYRYTKDALNELQLHLTASQVQWLQKKNKRRFLINIFRFLKNSKDISKTVTAINKAGFSFNDAMIAIFHFYSKAEKSRIFNM
jgi:glycosyltransferase involved in cell wall biosynthesis